MQYNDNSLTRDGTEMLAEAGGNQKAIIFDSLIVSPAVIPAGTDLSTLTVDSFTDPVNYPINSSSYTGSQYNVKSVVSNNPVNGTPITTDLELSLVGVMAHVDGDTDKKLLSVVVGTEPFTLPAYKGTDFNLRFGITQAYSSSKEVKFVSDNSAYALASDIDVVKEQMKTIQATIAAGVPGTDKDNTYTGKQIFAGGAVDKDGNPYMVDNGDGTITVNGIKMVPANDANVVKHNDAGTLQGKLNADYGDLTVDGLAVAGIGIATDEADATTKGAAMLAAGKVGIFIYTEGTTATDTSSDGTTS